MALIEVIEAKFLSKHLMAKTTVRTSEFIRDEEATLVESILKRADTSLRMVDAIADLQGEYSAKMAHDVIAKILNAQREVALRICMEESGKCGP